MGAGVTVKVCHILMCVVIKHSVMSQKKVRYVGMTKNRVYEQMVENVVKESIKFLKNL